MIFNCTIKATFEIPDGEMAGVVAQFKKNWEGENAELFPHDLINTAKSMHVGKLQFDEEDLECDEPALSESDIPSPKQRKARRK